MKKINYLKNLILAIGVISLTACGSEGEVNVDGEVQEVKTIQINGDISGADGQWARLLSFEGGKEVMIDSAQITSGKFSVQTKTNQLREYILLIGQAEMPIVFFGDESNEVVNINGSVPGVGENYTIEGSESGEEIREYLNFLKEFYETEQNYYANLNTTPPSDTVKIKEIVGKLDSISAIQRLWAIDHINENPSSPTNWLLLRELFPASGLMGFDPNDLSYFEKVSGALREKYPYSEYPDFIDKDIANIQSQIEAMNNPQPQPTQGNSPQIGDVAPDISLPDVNDNMLSLSSLKGKVVLIDFWASWCRPCRAENPNVVRMYEMYKDKGFTVFSVSLDEEEGAWKKAIEMDNLSWPNHVSDLKGWSSSAAALYGVMSIPSTFLIDQQGVVIGTNLRGAELEQKLQEVLG